MSEELGDLYELKLQLEHDIENLEKRIEILKEQGQHSVAERRKKVAQLAKITDLTVEETEANQSWVKPKEP